MTAQPNEGVDTTRGHWSSLGSVKKKKSLLPEALSPHPAAASGEEQGCRGMGRLASPVLLRGWAGLAMVKRILLGRGYGSFNTRNLAKWSLFFSGVLGPRIYLF